jgi:hypothetical protein
VFKKGRRKPLAQTSRLSSSPVKLYCMVLFI